MKTAFLLVALLSTSAESANVLALFTSPSPSHVIVHMSIAKALAEQGHNVTVATSLPIRDKSPKFKHILLRPDGQISSDIEAGMEEMSNAQGPLDKLKIMVNIVAGMTQLQYDVMRSDKLQSLIKTEKFDLVISGYFFNEFNFAVAAQLKLPIILSGTAHPSGFVNTFTGNPTFASFVPNSLMTNKQPMGFAERVKSFIGTGLFSVIDVYVNYKFGQYYE